MDRETLKKWFRTGAKPTEAQFAELIDSFRHVDEKLKVSDVENLAALIAQKMTREDALTLHEALAESIAELEEQKATPEGVREAIEQYHAPQEWTSESNLNDYTDTGVYHFSGYRLSAVDNLPIESVGETVNIAFTLIVDAHEGKLEGSTHVPCIVSQKLFLGNRQGSETRAYVRNATIFHDGQADAWEAWRELMQTTYLGVLQETHEGETLKSVTENGLYTGALFAPASTFDIFKLEVMNNYAMAQMYGTGNTVLQKITLLKYNGDERELTRKGTWNGERYVWTDFAENNIQMAEVAVGQQNTLGILKGGRNVKVATDGSVNVDSLQHESIDADTSDGRQQSTKFTINPAMTVAEAMHTYTDRVSEEVVYKSEEEQLTPVALTDYEPITALTKIYMGETRTIFNKIWQTALNEFDYLCENKYKNYTTRRLKHGLCRYPYYQGIYRFSVSLSESNSGLEMNLSDKNGNWLGSFATSDGQNYTLEISSFPTQNLAEILPFQITLRNASNDEYSYAGATLEMHTWQKGSVEVTDDYYSRYLYGNFVLEETVKSGFLDYSGNVAVCGDGILLQGRNQSCYIKITPDGNIETNLGEFVNG